MRGGRRRIAGGSGLRLSASGSAAPSGSWTGQLSPVRFVCLPPAFKPLLPFLLGVVDPNSIKQSVARGFVVEVGGEVGGFLLPLGGGKFHPFRLILGRRRRRRDEVAPKGDEILGQLRRAAKNAAEDATGAASSPRMGRVPACKCRLRCALRLAGGRRRCFGCCGCRLPFPRLCGLLRGY